MKKKILAFAGVFALGATLLTGCDEPKTYKDGTYTGKSDVVEEGEDSDFGGYGEVTITIEDGKITDCVFTTYKADGTVKDENYGVYVEEEPEEETEGETDGETEESGNDSEETSEDAEGEETAEGESEEGAEEDAEEEERDEPFEDKAAEDWYSDAQFAVAAAEEYARQLVDTGNIREVDVITGATYNYNMFVEAVNNALEQAVVEE